MLSLLFATFVFLLLCLLFLFISLPLFTHIHTHARTHIHVQGALDMRDKTVKDAMTPLESVFMLHYDDKIGHNNMEKVLIN